MAYNYMHFTFSSVPKIGMCPNLFSFMDCIEENAANIFRIRLDRTHMRPHTVFSVES